MIQDQVTLYTTIAQISATFVAVLGGFLLTLGLSRAAEMKRLDLRIKNAKRTIARIRREIEDHAAPSENATALAPSRSRLRSCRWLRNSFAYREGLVDSIVNAQRVLIHEQRAIVEWNEKRNILLALETELHEMEDSNKSQRYQVNLIRFGLQLLYLFTIVGVCAPLYFFPSEPGGIHDAQDAFLRRGGIALAASMAVYIYSAIVFVNPAASQKEQYDRWIFVSSFVVLAIWFVWPHPLSIGFALGMVFLQVLSASWPSLTWVWSKISAQRS